MAGDLKMWKGSDIAVGQNVKFERKGGWFITKTQALLAALFTLILIVAAILLTKYFTEESLKEKELKPEKNGSFLRENIIPVSYELLLNHSSNMFNGEMSLIFSLENSTDKIILRFKGESVSFAHLEVFDKSNKTGPQKLDIKSMEFNKEENVVEVTTSEMLTIGNLYNLTIKYLANINREEKGVFKIPYKYPVNGTTLEDRWIIGATLAPAYCSLVFPCVDISNDRPSFRLKIIRPKNIVSITNVLQKAVRAMSDPDLQLDDYEWTPQIPYTSLSYFLLPDYKVKMKQDSITGLNIWYPPHLENTTTPIAEAASSLIAFYNNFFDTPLPFQRVSIVIVDGLVTDRPGTLGLIPVSSNLLYSPENETFKREEKLLYYLGRKLSNQWLANIVKFKSVTNNWLEEGLALYMADLAASHNFLSYDVSTFLSLVQEKALQEEMFIHTQSSQNSPDCSNKDSYTPYKGAFVFHMLSGILDSRSFRSGLQQYIKKWKFNSTEPSDLWKSLNSVQDKIDVLKFVNSWDKTGYPVVSVDIENGTIALQQTPVSQEDTVVNNLWLIPITYTTEEEFDFDRTDFRAWLKEERGIVLNSIPNNSWIIVNPHYAGFFRTGYSESLWKMIEEDLKNKSSSFPSTVNAQLLDDSFSLASYELLDYKVPLNLSLYLQDETRIAPWITVLRHLNYLSLFLKTSDTDYENFKVYLEKLIGNIFLDLGYTRIIKEKPIFKYLRAELLEFSCQHELSNRCNEWAEESFTKWFNQSNMSGSIKTLSPELRSTAYCFGSRLYGQNSLTKLINISRASIIEPFEEFDILRSLTCTSDNEELKRLLQQSVDVNDFFFSAKRTIEIWLSLKRIPENSQAAFKFVRINWPSIFDKFQTETDIIKAILDGSTYALTEETYLEDVKKMRAKVESSANHETNIENILDAVIEKIKFNVNWRKNNLKYVNTWFRDFNNTVNGTANSIQFSI